MKKISTIIFNLFVLFSYCQNMNIYAEYGIKLMDDEAYTKDALFNETFQSAKNNDSKVSFGLIIHQNRSKFFDKSIMESNNQNVVMTKIFANYIGLVYNCNDSIYYQNPLLGEKIYTKALKKENWTLLNETKLIDNYLCYKATNVNVVINSKGTFKYPVIAWYCPTLPYSFGPNGYGNLPGLILELQVRNVLFFLKKIDLNSKEILDVDFIKKIKILSDEELQVKLNEFNRFDEIKK